MRRIHLRTFVKAPVERVFDLSRSIDLHMDSMSHTNEIAVAGKTSGLIGLNETVTWRAKHLFATRFLTVTITQMTPYSSFRDEMVKGDFKSMIHTHSFVEENSGTLMTDDFQFESPYGWVGRLVDAVFLTKYMRKLLIGRNSIIKQYAETNKWKNVLHKK